MVELGNHQGRPPGGNSSLMPTEASSSLMDHWMNREMNLDILESQEHYPQNYQVNNYNVYQENGTLPSYHSTFNNHQINAESALKGLRFDSPLSFEKDLFEVEGASLHESLMQVTSNNETSFKELSEKLSNEAGIYGFTSWGAPMDIDALKLEEVFQVDQSDLVQGPTLAELNANDDPFFDLEFGYDFTKDIPGPNAQMEVGKNKNSTCTYAMAQASGASGLDAMKMNRPILNSRPTPVQAEKESSEIQLKPILTNSIPKIKIEAEETVNVTPSKKVQIQENPTVRAPTLAPASIVAARMAGRERQRSGLSISSISSLSSLSNDDEGFGSQAEEEDDDDDSDAQLSSDEDSCVSPFGARNRSKFSTNDLNRPTTSGLVSKNNKSKASGRKKRYFWQYNIQSKGPKVCIPSHVLPGTALDPHVLDDALDPVFSPECSLEGVKHAGKARRGDGNDLTPCPRKLHNIGSELNALNDMINDLTPVSDVPFNARPKSRKEKNKLASRACRLKKKAQHEANKLKLYGLQKEHKAMNALIPEVRQMLRVLLKLDDSKDEKLDLKPPHFQDALNKLLAKKFFVPVAGNTAEFVNQVLEKVAAGDPNGGLKDL